MGDLAVAWATDRAYAAHTAASVHSVLSREPRAIAYVFVAPGLRPSDLRRFKELGRRTNARIEVVEFDEAMVRGLPTVRNIPAVMWYRVFLPQLLPACRRVLYLDADTIAITTVAPLFRLDMDGCDVAAVENVTEPGKRDLASELGLSVDQGYFNSGVLLMDLEAMRQSDATSRILEAAATSTPWPDQDALNVALGRSRLRLHPKWNAQNSLFFWRDWAEAVYGPAAEEARKDPAILHFEGHGPGTKPWDDRSGHPRRDAYLTHAHATPWPRKSDLRTRVSREVRRLPRLLKSRVRPS